MNTKKTKKLTMELLDAVDLGYLSSATIPFEYTIKPDGSRILDKNGQTAILFRNAGIIRKIADEHGSLTTQRAVKNHRNASKRDWSDYLEDDVYQELTTLGITPVMAYNAQILQDGLRSFRQGRKQVIKKKNSLLDIYKEQWNTMCPDRVEKVLPAGTAVGVEIEFILPALSEKPASLGHEELTRQRLGQPANPDLRLPPLPSSPPDLHLNEEDPDTEEEEEDETIIETWNRSQKTFQPPSAEKLFGVSWGYDTSVRPRAAWQYKEGQEVRVMLKYQSWGRLIKVCEVLKKEKAMFNARCGLHVHLDTRDLSTQREETKCRRLESALPWLFDMVPASRRNNEFCHPYYSSSEKYAAINTHSRGRRSIECRLHSSSMNPKKIINWIEILMFISNNYKHLNTLEDFLESEIHPYFKKWVVSRTCHFENKKQQQHEDSLSERIAEASATE